MVQITQASGADAAGRIAPDQTAEKSAVAEESIKDVKIKESANLLAVLAQSQGRVPSAVAEKQQVLTRFLSAVADKDVKELGENKEPTARKLSGLVTRLAGKFPELSAQMAESLSKEGLTSAKGDRFVSEMSARLATMPKILQEGAPAGKAFLELMAQTEVSSVAGKDLGSLKAMVAERGLEITQNVTPPERRELAKILDATIKFVYKNQPSPEQIAKETAVPNAIADSAASDGETSDGKVLKVPASLVAAVKGLAVPKTNAAKQTQNIQTHETKSVSDAAPKSTSQNVGNSESAKGTYLDIFKFTNMPQPPANMSQDALGKIRDIIAKAAQIAIDSKIMASPGEEIAKAVQTEDFSLEDLKFVSELIEKAERQGRIMPSAKSLVSASGTREENIGRMLNGASQSIQQGKPSSIKNTNALQAQLTHQTDSEQQSSSSGPTIEEIDVELNKLLETIKQSQDLGKITESLGKINQLKQVQIELIRKAEQQQTFANRENSVAAKQQSVSGNSSVLQNDAASQTSVSDYVSKSTVPKDSQTLQKATSGDYVKVPAVDVIRTASPNSSEDGDPLTSSLTKAIGNVLPKSNPETTLSAPRSLTDELSKAIGNTNTRTANQDSIKSSGESDQRAVSIEKPPIPAKIQSDTSLPPRYDGLQQQSANDAAKAQAQLKDAIAKPIETEIPKAPAQTVPSQKQAEAPQPRYDGLQQQAANDAAKAQDQLKEASAKPLETEIPKAPAQTVPSQKQAEVPQPRYDGLQQQAANDAAKAQSQLKDAIAKPIETEIPKAPAQTQTVPSQKQSEAPQPRYDGLQQQAANDAAKAQAQLKETSAKPLETEIPKASVQTQTVPTQKQAEAPQPRYDGLQQQAANDAAKDQSQLKEASAEPIETEIPKAPVQTQTVPSQKQAEAPQPRYDGLQRQAANDAAKVQSQPKDAIAKPLETEIQKAPVQQTVPSQKQAEAPQPRYDGLQQQAANDAAKAQSQLKDAIAKPIKTEIPKAPAQTQTVPSQKQAEAPQPRYDGLQQQAANDAAKVQSQLKEASAKPIETEIPKAPVQTQTVPTQKQAEAPQPRYDGLQQQAANDAAKAQSQPKDAIAKPLETEIPKAPVQQTVPSQKQAEAPQPRFDGLQQQAANDAAKAQSQLKEAIAKPIETEIPKAPVQTQTVPSQKQAEAPQPRYDGLQPQAANDAAKAQSQLKEAIAKPIEAEAPRTSVQMQTDPSQKQAEAPQPRYDGLQRQAANDAAKVQSQPKDAIAKPLETEIQKAPSLQTMPSQKLAEAPQPRYAGLQQAANDAAKAQAQLKGPSPEPRETTQTKDAVHPQPAKQTEVHQSRSDEIRQHSAYGRDKQETRAPVAQNANTANSFSDAKRSSQSSMPDFEAYARKSAAANVDVSAQRRDVLANNLAKALGYEPPNQDIDSQNIQIHRVQSRYENTQRQNMITQNAAKNQAQIRDALADLHNKPMPQEVPKSDDSANDWSKSIVKASDSSAHAELERVSQDTAQDAKSSADIAKDRLGALQTSQAKTELQQARNANSADASVTEPRRESDAVLTDKKGPEKESFKKDLLPPPPARHEVTESPEQRKALAGRIAKVFDGLTVSAQKAPSEFSRLVAPAAVAKDTEDDLPLPTSNRGPAKEVQQQSQAGNANQTRTNEMPKPSQQSSQTDGLAGIQESEDGMEKMPVSGRPAALAHDASLAKTEASPNTSSSAQHDSAPKNESDSLNAQSKDSARTAQSTPHNAVPAREPASAQHVQDAAVRNGDVQQKPSAPAGQLSAEQRGDTSKPEANNQIASAKQDSDRGAVQSNNLSQAAKVPADNPQKQSMGENSASGIEAMSKNAASETLSAKNSAPDNNLKISSQEEMALQKSQPAETEKNTANQTAPLQKSTISVASDRQQNSSFMSSLAAASSGNWSGANVGQPASASGIADNGGAIADMADKVMASDPEEHKTEASNRVAERSETSADDVSSQAKSSKDISESNEKLSIFKKIAGFFRGAQSEDLREESSNAPKPIQTTRIMHPGMRASSADDGMHASENRIVPTAIRRFVSLQTSVQPQAAGIEASNTGLSSLLRDLSSDSVPEAFKPAADLFKNALDQDIGSLATLMQWFNYADKPLSGSNAYSKGLRAWATMLVATRMKQLGFDVDEKKSSRLAQAAQIAEDAGIDDGDPKPQMMLNNLLDHVSSLRRNAEGRGEDPVFFYVPLPTPQENKHENGMSFKRGSSGETDDNAVELHFYFEIKGIGPVSIKARCDMPDISVKVTAETYEGFSKVRDTLPQLEERFSQLGLNAKDCECHRGRVSHPLKSVDEELSKSYKADSGLSFRI